MTITVKQVVEAFDHLYVALRDKKFTKSLRLDEWTERDLLPLVRTFLLGWFRHGFITPEHKSSFPGRLSGNGRIDFVVGDVAVELAVRCKGGSKQNLSNTVNAAEAKKLMKYQGLALLVLFDFSNDPLPEDKIDRFRDWPSLGKGRHAKSPFNVSYHYRDPADKQLKVMRKNISVL